MEKIVSYYLTDNKIIIKHSNRKVSKLDLNSNNVLILLNQLEKQTNFNINEVNERVESDYEKSIINLVIGAIVQGILCLAVCLSFINGFMVPFVISILLSVIWVLYVAKVTIKNLSVLKVSCKCLKLFESKEDLAIKYNNLIAKENNSQLLHVLS